MEGNILRTIGCLLALVLIFSRLSVAQEADLENLPDDVLTDFATGPFAQTYSVSERINPFCLRGDFDGDGKADYAVLLVARKDGSNGIGIWLSSQKKVLVLGAGQKFKLASGESSDLSFLNTWKVYSKKSVERGVEAGPPPTLIGEAILAGKKESASGLIYWTGKQFAWYQQGD